MIMATDLAYAVLDTKLKLQELSPAFASHFPGSRVGGDITECIPVLHGQEELGEQLLAGSLPYWFIHGVAQPQSAGLRYFDLHLSALPENHLLLISRDVTLEMELEQKLIQQRNELRLLQSRPNIDDLPGQARSPASFHALLLHDARAPLTLLAGLAHKTLVQDTANLAAGQQHTLQRIVALADEVISLLGGAVQSTRLEEGAAGVDFGPVAISTLLKETIALCQPMLGVQQQTIQLHYSEPLGQVAGSPTLLIQAFCNLCMTLAAFQLPEMDIEIVASRQDDFVHVLWRLPHTALEKQQLQAMFQPFRYGFAGDNPPGQPPAMALFLARILLEAHGGSLEVVDDDNGSSLLALLPLVYDSRSAL